MPNNPTSLERTDGPVPDASRHVTAALTRSSTGTEDLRELEAGLDSLQSDAAAPGDWSRILLPVAALVVLISSGSSTSPSASSAATWCPARSMCWARSAPWGEGKLQEAVWTSLQRGLVGLPDRVPSPRRSGCCWPRWPRCAAPSDR